MTFRLRSLVSLCVLLVCASMCRAQQLSLQGLRSQNGLGQFNGLQADSAGNLYTLLDAGDGVRLLKFDPTGTQLVNQAMIGGAGDQGLALVLDALGNIYVTGTSSGTGNVVGKGATAFPTRADTTINSFLVKFLPDLTEQWLTFLGSGKMSVAAVAVANGQVVVTGAVYSKALPVTPDAIQQSPSPGTAGDGFVQGYSTGTGTLNVSTYLSGGNGYTIPSSLAVDSSGNIYVAGTTSATGFPAVNALVEDILYDGSTPVSGFLAKFTPNVDGISFSTYIPGNGITSASFDNTTNTILLSGNIARGLFPLTIVPAPIAAKPTYQTAVRITADGSSVTSATLLAPSTTSAIAASATGYAVTTTNNNVTNLPLLPVAASQSLGNAYIFQTDSKDVPQRAARLGGLPVTSSASAGLPALTTAILSATDGSAIVAGGLAPTMSQQLIATERFDVSLVNAPTTGLPSTVRDAMPVASNCSGSACAGGAGLLARLSASTEPELSFSVDNLPNITLRNTGSTDATGVSVTVTGYTATACPSILPAGGECDIALTGAGPGTITATSSNAGSTPITSLGTNTVTAATIAVSPKELDFGSVSAVSGPRTRTLTVTNFTGQTRTIVSKLAGTVINPNAPPGTGTAAPVAENYAVQGACVPQGDGYHDQVPPNTTCTIQLVLTPNTDPSTDTAISLAWTVDTREVALTGYTQAAALSVSATHIGFGEQFNSGLRGPRTLWLSNGSDVSQSHTLVSLPSTSPFQVTDTCPTTIAPQSVCAIGVTYNSLIPTSTDSTTLTVDGLAVLIDGMTVPPPSVTGSSVNPSLSVTPTAVTFANPVTVTTVSTETQTVTIQNTGAVDFALTTAVTGDFTATTCAATLTAGSSCVVTLHFTPSDSGTRQGLLSVTAGSTKPVYVTLTGTGTSITSQSSSPVLNGTIDFGEEPVNAPTVRWTKVTTAFPSLTVAVSSSNYGVLIVEDQGYGYGSPDRNSFKQSATGTCFNCYIGVQFLPSQTGSLTGTLTLNTTTGGAAQTTALTGIGDASTGVLFRPATGNFGSTAVGSTSVPTTFVLTNATTAAITTGTPMVTGDYSISTAATGGTTCGGSLAVGASCVTAVQFAPTATGTRTGQVSITTSAGAVTSALTGVGTSSTGISFNPTALIFNNTPGAGSTTQTITVTNTSSAAATITPPTSSDSHFTATTTCGTLAPGAACTITVTYTPTQSLASGLLSVSVTTTTNGTAQTTNNQLSLTANYTQENAGIQVVPGETATVHFGALATGSVSGVRVFQINNVSSKSVTVTTQAPRQFPIVGSTCGALAPGAACSLSVAYAPITDGDVTGTIFVQATATDGSGTLTGLGYVEGYGLASNTLVASGNFSPTGVLDFGQVGSGQSSTQTVTLTNQGGGASGATSITIRRISVASPYSSTTTCGNTLAVNGTCTVAITYTPINQTATGSTTSTTQTNTGVLTVESDAENAPYLIDLSGTAAAVQTASPSNTAPLSILTLSQGAVSFNTVATVGTASATQTITVSNAGTTTIHILNLLTSTDFQAQSYCATLNPGDTCSINLNFTPQSAGTHSSALELQTDAATSLEFVSLLGTAVPANASLTPTTLDFGSVLLGNNKSLNATFTNTGTSAVTITSINATTADYSPTGSATTCAIGATVAPGGSCVIGVVFSPAVAGTRTGVLSVGSSATSLALQVALTGIGAQPQLTATPNGLSFGDVLTGKSASLSFTLANTSTTDVNNLAFSITGDYAATSNCGPVTLRAQSSCSVTVTFTPTLAGTRIGTLTITSSDPSSPLLIPLTGNGVQGGSFTLTANGVTTASATEPVAIPASYTLAVTPTGGFTGAVALTCTPQGVYAYISCSITPSTVTLLNGAQTSVATITTVTGAASSAAVKQPTLLPTQTSRAEAIAACLLAPGVLLLRRRRALRLPLLFVLLSVVLTSVSGCGSGVGDSRIRYGAPGNYQFIVTASSTTGVTVSQSVTLNLTITN